MNDYLRAEVKSIDAKGSWTAVASSSVLDRDGERILPRALTWRTPSLPVHVDHSFQTATLIGRCSPHYDSKGVLMVDGTFGSSPLAQATRQQVVDGSLDSMSVVFHGAKTSKGRDGATEITAGELIACDFVTIPSNVDARVLTARGLSSGVTVAQARRLVQETMRDLLRLDIAEAERVLGLKHGPASRFVRSQLRSSK